MGTPQQDTEEAIEHLLQTCKIGAGNVTITPQDGGKYTIEVKHYEDRIPTAAEMLPWITQNPEVPTEAFHTTYNIGRGAIVSTTTISDIDPEKVAALIQAEKLAENLRNHKEVFFSQDDMHYGDQNIPSIVYQPIKSGAPKSLFLRITTSITESATARSRHADLYGGEYDGSSFIFKTDKTQRIHNSIQRVLYNDNTYGLNIPLIPETIDLVSETYAKRVVAQNNAENMLRDATQDEKTKLNSQAALKLAEIYEAMGIQKSNSPIPVFNTIGYSTPIQKTPDSAKEIETKLRDLLGDAVTIHCGSTRLVQGARSAAVVEAGDREHAHLLSLRPPFLPAIHDSRRGTIPYTVKEQQDFIKDLDAALELIAAQPQRYKIGQNR